MGHWGSKSPRPAETHTGRADINGGSSAGEEPSVVQSLSDRLRAVAAAAAGVVGAGSRQELRRVLEEACQTVISFDAFFIMAYDPTSNTFHGFGGHDVDYTSPPNVVPAGGTPGERVVQRRKSLLTLRADDPEAQGAHLTGSRQRSESVIRTPILAGDEVLGIFSVQSYTPDLYTQEDVEVIEVIASLAATAILNLRLTEQNRATEKALVERERQLNEAQRIARLGNWTWAVGGEEVTWSDELYRIYGVDRSTFVPSLASYLERLHPADRSRVEQLVRRAADTGERCEFEERIVRPDGAERVLQSFCEAVRGEDGEVQRLVGVCMDVTEMKSAEAALRSSEESYRTIFDLASDAIFVHDIETGAILDANQRACDLYGCTLGELKLLGVAGISEGVAPYDEEHARMFVSKAAEGDPQRFEWRIRDRTGATYWVEVSLKRVRILGDQRVLASVRNIDERKRAEEALKRAHDELEQRVARRTEELARRTSELESAEQRFRAIVEASPTPLLLSRLDDGVIFYANDRLETLIGVPPGGLAGRKTVDFYFDAADRPRVIGAIQEAGYVRSVELKLRRADGCPIWVSLSVQRLIFDGQPALATALLDITEQKQAEEALRASEESYRNLFDNLTELVCIQSLDGNFISVNDAFVRAYGHSREEVVGRTPQMLAAPGLVDMDEMMEHYARAAAGERRRFDWWGRRKDGSVFPKEIVLNRARYFGQDVIIAVARDISERVEAEAAIRRSEEHFRRLIENASDLISILAPDGTVRYQSPAVKRMLGYEPDEIVGRNAFDFVAPEDIPQTRAEFGWMIQHPGTPVRAEFRFRHKDGTWRYVESLGTTISPTSVDDGLVVNSRDVSERKDAEAALRFQKTLLEAQGEASIDGILVVSSEGEILSYNQRFVDMWGIPQEIMESHSDQAAIQCVLDKLVNPSEFEERIAYLYGHPEERARDEIFLRDGRVLDRYTAPVVSVHNEYYGRIWFFRDITVQKRYTEVLDRARREAEDATERANRYALELEREMEVGRKIQTGFLPGQLPQVAGWDIAAQIRPASRVAGDFYDVFWLGDRLGIVIADVCGKGLGAALFMALFQSLLRANAERELAVAAHGSGSVERILSGAVRATNAYVTRVHRPTHIFASVFFGMLEPTEGTVDYINAGHLPPAVVRRDSSLVRLDPTGPALGLLSDPDFGVRQVSMEPSEALVAFTDGVTEARNDARDFFSEERLHALLLEGFPSAASLGHRIRTAVDEFVADAPPSDDLTLLVVRRAFAQVGPNGNKTS